MANKLTVLGYDARGWAELIADNTEASLQRRLSGELRESLVANAEKQIQRIMEATDPNNRSRLV